MAFPLIALITAAASDMQSNADEEAARNALGRQVRQRLLHTRAQQMGAQPYGAIESDYENSLANLRQQADASRNNNIGVLLQAYLGHSLSGGGEKYGDDYAQKLAANPGDGGFGMGNVMGKAQLDSWDKDPWGDAGY